MDMMNVLAVTSDTLTKNIDKVEQPRGEGGGKHAAFNMY